MVFREISRVLFEYFIQIISKITGKSKLILKNDFPFSHIFKQFIIENFLIRKRRHAHKLVHTLFTPSKQSRENKIC